MRIWHENYTLKHVIALRDNNLNKHLGIKFTEITKDSISATMPVEDITRQSRGILHGGASCVLAESLGSIASNLCLDMKKQKAVGLELNANHIRPVRSGLVTGGTKAVALGRSVHVWNIEIYNEAGKINCVSRLTTAIVDLKEDEKEKNIKLVDELLSS